MRQTTKRVSGWATPLALVSGKEDGRKLGLNMGFQVGEELGFYQSCLDIWIAAAHINHDAFSDRMKKNLEQMAAFLSSYPIGDPENEQIQEIMGKVVSNEHYCKLGSEIGV
ncbi:hypothetical protein C2845_PM04G03000 [Panicum miliaceum]|uniref:Uncharacterized protein n=1 Tax=Panicum miliaceum TaxID=4540 RepID=A0A3L6QME6_PANMI|nr:hypothetical protein C2845_PM04G03000 [Panicum miliaceum]